MTIPILHHNFDATGIDLTYTYWTLGIIIVAILVFFACLFRAFTKFCRHAQPLRVENL